MPLQCRCDGTAMSVQYQCCFDAMSMPYRCHVDAVSMPCRCQVDAMSTQRRCYKVLWMPRQWAQNNDGRCIWCPILFSNSHRRRVCSRRCFTATTSQSTNIGHNVSTIQTQSFVLNTMSWRNVWPAKFVSDSFCFIYIITDFASKTQRFTFPYCAHSLNNHLPFQSLCIPHARRPTARLFTLPDAALWTRVMCMLPNKRYGGHGKGDRSGIYNDSCVRQSQSVDHECIMPKSWKLGSLSSG